MKIMHVIATLGPGGAEAFVASLASMQSIDGNDVSVFLMAGVRGDRGHSLLTMLHDSGVQVIGVESRSARSIMNIVKIVSEVHKKKPDVIHAHLYSAEVLSVIAKILLFKSTLTLFRTLHSTEIVGNRNGFVVKLMDKFFDTSVGCGESVSESYKYAYKDKHKTNLITINNGIAPPSNLTSEGKNSIKIKIGVPENCFLIINVGGFRGQSLELSAKAHDVMILAFKEYLEINPNSHMILIGDGELIDQAKNLVHNLNIEANVKFTGIVSNPSIYYQAADLFFMPSRYEGLPISLLEASSYGLPVVASDISEIRNLMNNYPWILSPPNDFHKFSLAIEQAEKKVLTGEFGPQYGFSIVEKYSIAECSRKYISAYSQRARI